MHIVSVPSDVIGLGTGIAAIADEASEVMNEFDRPIIRFHVLKRVGSATIRQEIAVSKFDIAFLAVFAGMIFKAITLWRDGSSPYEWIKDESVSILNGFQRSIQKLAESAGSIASSFTGPIGAGIGALGGGIGEIGKGLGRAGEAFASAISNAIESIADNLSTIVEAVLKRYDKTIDTVESYSPTALLNEITAILRSFAISTIPSTLTEGISALSLLQKSLNEKFRLSTNKVTRKNIKDISTMIDTYINAAVKKL